METRTKCIQITSKFINLCFHVLEFFKFYCIVFYCMNDALLSIYFSNCNKLKN